MAPLYSSNQFESAKSREKLPLRCNHCGKTFYWAKKLIKEALKGVGGRSGNFCSPKCYQAARPRNTIDCEECGKFFGKSLKEVEDSLHSFCSHHCSATFYNRKRWGAKWEQETARVPKVPKPLHTCKSCGKETKNRSYCDGTCRNKALNPLIKGNRSKAERWLVAALKGAYPLWTIEENNRIMLDGLELDLYIPEIKLAIEWNGIFHFEPIRGQDKLERIMVKDNTKIERCRELGIELIVICDRTSHDSFIRQTIAALIEQLEPLYKMASR